MGLMTAKEELTKAREIFDEVRENPQEHGYTQKTVDWANRLITQQAFKTATVGIVEDTPEFIRL